MREIKINNKEAGQRFDKYLKKYMSQAGSGFIYKMLRKKNITLNGKKAGGNEILAEGDVVKMFFSEDTFEKFTSSSNTKAKKCEIDVKEVDGKKIIVYKSFDIEILYEDDNVMFMNKPAGVLSQPDNTGVISMVEILASYFSRSGETDGEPSGFRPGICNRLDRNTSGVIAAGKTVKGLQQLSETIRNREVKKMYMCVVEGKVTCGGELKGYLTKDEKTNKVSLSDNRSEGASHIETRYNPVKSNGLVTMMEVQLITGKTHQIRAHMASIGHPVLGDVKYASSIKGTTKHQMLHAHRMIFAQTKGVLLPLSGKTIEAELPKEYNSFFK